MESATGAHGASSIAYDEIASPPEWPPEGKALRERITRPALLAATPRVSVVIPTLNEAKNLPHVMGELPPWVDEVILVDGYSTDDTIQVAHRLRPDVVIVHQSRPGKGDALRCGFEAASGDVLVMLDADGSADPTEISRFLQALLAGADFAKGTRFAEGGGSDDLTPLRRTGNWFFSMTVNLLFGTSYSDLCYGYNAFWRHCLPAMSVDCCGFEVETLINIRIARSGLKIAEVPSYERLRIHGESNLRPFRDGARVLRTIVRERLRRSPHVPHNWPISLGVDQHPVAEALSAQAPVA